MKVKHSVNSSSFNWFQPIPEVLPNQIRQDLLEISADLSLPWRSYTPETLQSSPDKFIDRGRRSLNIHQHYRQFHEWFENSNLFQSLDRNSITENLTLPSMISVLFDSGKHSMGIQPHTDRACSQTRWKQLRFNFMVQNAEHGGNPIINDQMLTIPDNHGWYLFATDQNHRALPVKGDRERIILSLAYYIDPAYIPEAKQILTSSTK